MCRRATGGLKSGTDASTWGGGCGRDAACAVIAPARRAACGVVPVTDLFLGIDAGGTSAKARLVDGEGHVLAEAYGGPRTHASASTRFMPCS